MDEHDLFSSFARKPSDGAAMLRKLKTAGLAQMGVDAAKKNAIPLAAAAAAAGIAMGAQYGLSHPGKGGTPSADQSLAAAALKLTQAREDRAKKEGKPMGLTEDIAHSLAKSHSHFADTFSRHPGKSALLAAPTGAAVGWQIAQRLKNLA